MSKKPLSEQIVKDSEAVNKMDPAKLERYRTQLNNARDRGEINRSPSNGRIMLSF